MEKLGDGCDLCEVIWIQRVSLLLAPRWYHLSACRPRQLHHPEPTDNFMTGDLVLINGEAVRKVYLSCHVSGVHKRWIVLSLSSHAGTEFQLLGSG